MKKNRNKKIERRYQTLTGIQFALFCILLCLSGILIGILLDKNLEMDFSETKVEDVYFDKIIVDCNNLDIFEAAECVTDKLKDFEYNISNQGKDLNFTEFKKIGGVCSHFSKVYIQIGKELGFYTTKVIIKTDELELNNETYNIQHSFTIWSSEKGYILLDNTNSFAFEFEDNTEEFKKILKER